MNRVAPMVSAERAPLAIVERIRLRARRMALWMRHLWQQGETSADLGLAITHGEVDRLLRPPAEVAREMRSFFATDVEAAALADPIAQADHAMMIDADWSELCRSFGLSRPEGDLLALAVAADLDPNLTRVYAYLQDDVQAQSASQFLAAQLFDWPPGTALPTQSMLLHWRLAKPLEAGRSPWLPRTAWSADPAIAISLREGGWDDPEIAAATTLHFGDEGVAKDSLFPDVLSAIEAFVGAAGDTGSVEIELIGPAGTGKRTLAGQLSAEQQRPLLICDLEALVRGKASEAGELVLRVQRAARRHGAIIHWRAADTVDTTTWRAVQGNIDLAFFDRETPAARSSAMAVLQGTFALPPLSAAARETLWSKLSNRPLPAPVRDRLLTAGQIATAALAVAGGDAAVRHAIRPPVQPPADLLQPLASPYTWADLVLTAGAQGELREFEQQARLRWQVYEDWGFGRIASAGKGIAALFAGPSGTGKTMAAQVLARSLGLELMRVDLSGVVNKYIGETEKRLKQVFDYCERGNVMLLFDECDALFGQRMQVKDAHDRFANIEIDYLLQRVEQFSGIAVLTTNRKNDLDKAFLRRIQFLVDFAPPGSLERARLWELALAPLSPSGRELTEGLNYNALGETLAMTGADIKAAALSAAFLARAEGSNITMRHVLRAARRELTKHGVVVRMQLEGGN